MEAAQSALRYRGIRAGLDFGFLSPSRLDGAQEAGQEGSQSLEDGTLFRDRDWRNRNLDGSLPAAFGLRAPETGFATERSRTYGLYSTDLAGLGSWGPKVSGLTSARRFQVLLDSRKARVFAFRDELGGFVPVLWVDRFGHWVSFQWRWEEGAGGRAMSVQAKNANGQGVKVCWAMPGPSEQPVDLVRADFIGLPAPSLLVQGYPGPAIGAPRGMSGGKAIPAETGIPVCRPTLVRLGAPGDLPVPSFVPALPKVVGAPRTPPRDWIFGYTDLDRAELETLADPWGLITRFRHETRAFPEAGYLFRAVAEATSLDAETGVTHNQAWCWQGPARAGGDWSVRLTERFSDGTPTEQRETTHTYAGDWAESGQPWLRATHIKGTAGSAQVTRYEVASGVEPARPGRIQVAATGRPETEVIRSYESATGNLEAESLKVGGKVIQTTRFTYQPCTFGMGQGLPATRTVEQPGLPSLQERFEHSREGLLVRHTLLAGGEERGRIYRFDPEGRLSGIQPVASWTSDTGLQLTYDPGPLGPAAVTASGPGLDQPLRWQWAYDPMGQISIRIDPRGLKAGRTQDLWGRPLTVAGEGRQTRGFTYPDERILAWSQGTLSGWDRYDCFGRLAQRLRADGVTETYLMDQLGRRVAVQERSGEVNRTVLEVTYDALDRVVRERLAAGKPRSYTFRVRDDNYTCASVTTTPGRLG